MTQVISRHIRHDWRTWVDSQRGRTVMSLCGAKTRPGLAGIPGITNQTSTIIDNGVTKWGWCNRCVIKFYRGNRSVDRTPFPEEIDELETSEDIRGHYLSAFNILFGQYDAYMQKAQPGLVWNRTYI